MNLEILFNSIKILAKNIDFDIEFTEISADSRKIVKNGVFVAIKGTCQDGNEHIDEAISKGAIAIVTDEINKCTKDIPYVLVQDARSALSLMWSNYYSNPSEDLKIIAITGTNGKTTTAYLIYNILKKAKKHCALISTVEILIDDKRIEIEGGCEITNKIASMTTPDPKYLHYLLNEMRKNKVEFVVMEASSHALEQNRLEGCKIEIGIFTNISHDHLDYHKDMESYFLAKEKLFKVCKLGIINYDDDYGKILVSRYRGRSLAYSCIDKADIYVTNVKKNGYGSKFLVNSKTESYNVETKLIGSFNIYNCLCAIICANSLGIERKYIKDGIKNTKRVTGRLEKYNKKCIFIDYAHTPEAMKLVLREIRSLYPRKKLIALFGCGGDRDREKRSKMGEIATEMADFAIITSDNSRNESTSKIISDIVACINEKKNFVIIEDREKAIRFGVKTMKRTGVLILLGKGHETYQISENGKTHFDERVILDRIFKK